MKKLNILFISTACAPSNKETMTYGGIERVLLDFIEPLAEEGHTITVAAPQGSRFPDSVHYFPTVKLPEQAWMDNVATDLLFQQQLIPDGFDIIHDFSHQHLAGRITHGYWAQPHPFLFQVWHPASFMGSPNNIHEPTYNLCGLGVYHSTTLSRLYNQEVKYGYLGTDTEQYKYQKDKGDRYLFCSVPSRQKGVLEAIKLAKDNNLKLDLVCGALPTEGQDYINLIKNACDGEQIKYIGGVLEDEKIRYMQNAKGLIFPVLQDEPFGLVMTECMSTGTPVFALNHGSPAEIIGTDGGVVANSLRELSTAIKKYDKDPSLFAPEMVRRRAVTLFDRKVMVEGYKKLYQLILDKEFWY